MTPPSTLGELLKPIQERLEKATPLEARIYTPPFDEQIDLFWTNPYANQPEKFASIWWPEHPVEKTQEVESTFEATAEFIAHSRTDVERLISVVTELYKAHEKIIHRISNNCDCDMTSETALQDAESILRGDL